VTSAHSRGGGLAEPDDRLSHQFLTLSLLIECDVFVDGPIFYGFKVCIAVLAA